MHKERGLITMDQRKFHFSRRNRNALPVTAARARAPPANSVAPVGLHPFSHRSVLGAGAVQRRRTACSPMISRAATSASGRRTRARDMCQPVQRGARRQLAARRSVHAPVQLERRGALGRPRMLFRPSPCRKQQWPYKSEFLLRLWVKYDQDVSHTYGGKVLRFFPRTHLDQYVLIAQMRTAGGPAQSAWLAFNGVQGPTYWGAGMPLGNHAWHKLEIYVKASTSADGIARVWFDGDLKQEVTNTVTVAPGKSWGPLYLMSNWSNNPGWEHGANNHIYWDDVEMYTDTGVGGTGQMSDASIHGGSPRVCTRRTRRRTSVLISSRCGIWR